MRAGTLRDWVQIQEPVRNQSASGAVSRTWDVFCTVRADVRPLRGDLQYQAANQLGGRQGFRVRIRYLKGIRTNMRILHEPECNDQYLSIEAIAWDDKKTMHELTCALNELDGTRNEKD